MKVYNNQILLFFSPFYSSSLRFSLSFLSYILSNCFSFFIILFWFLLILTFKFEACSSFFISVVFINYSLFHFNGYAFPLYSFTGSEPRMGRGKLHFSFVFNVFNVFQIFVFLHKLKKTNTKFSYLCSKFVSFFFPFSLLFYSVLLFSLPFINCYMAIFCLFFIPIDLLLDFLKIYKGVTFSSFYIIFNDS